MEPREAFKNSELGVEVISFFFFFSSFSFLFFHDILQISVFWICVLGRDSGTGALHLLPPRKLDSSAAETPTQELCVGCRCPTCDLTAASNACVRPHS